MPQSLSQLYVHLIFSTKHREPMLLSPVREDLHAYLAAVLNNQDSPALKVGGTSDHVHALFRLSKNLALAKVVEEAKTIRNDINHCASTCSGGLRPPPSIGDRRYNLCRCV